MKSSLVLFVVIVFAAMSPAHAQGARMCAPTNAEKTTVAAIAADPAAWMGKCVTMPAIYSNELLYADQDAVYGVNKSVIGGFSDGKGTIEGFWSGQYTGRVADCAAAQQELSLGLLRSPGISVGGRPMGCPEPKGPFLLFMSQRDLVPTTLVRRLRKDAGATGGDLQPAPADWAYLSAVRDIAGRFLAAIEGKDRAGLKELIHNDYAVEQVIADSSSPINALTGPKGGAPQIFVRKAAGGTSSPDAFQSEACWCVKGNCSARWPVARRDADNQGSRPYACLKIDGTRDGAGAWTYDVDASQDFDGLPEPR